MPLAYEDETTMTTKDGKGGGKVEEGRKNWCKC